MTDTTDDLRRLEEAALCGLPALRTEPYDGWLLRFAAGYSRRANAVVPLYPSRLDLGEKIAHCEAAYERAGLPCLFRIPSRGAPEGLDEALAARGYERHAETLVLVADLDEVPAPGGPIDLRDAPEGLWLDTWEDLSDRRMHARTLHALLSAVPTPAIYAAVMADGKGVACARAVLGDGVVGLYDLMVAPAHRRRGLATGLVRARLGWAREQGVRRALLQVMAGNDAARRLQAGFGFREAYRYWYRQRP